MYKVIPPTPHPPYNNILFHNNILFQGKPRGLRTARKQRTHRRDQRWHDKDYKKSHLGTRWKAKSLEVLPTKGIVLEKVWVDSNIYCFKEASLHTNS